MGEAGKVFLELSSLELGLQGDRGGKLGRVFWN